MWTSVDNEDIKVGDRVRFLGNSLEYTIATRQGDDIVVQETHSTGLAAYKIQEEDRFERWEEPVQAEEAPTATDWVKCDLSTLSPGSPIVITNSPADLEGNPTVFDFVKYYSGLKIVAVRDPINGHTSAYYDNEHFTFYTKRTVREPSPPAPKIIDDYPHTCYHCGSPAYVGEYGIDCKGKCEASK
jgi:hypothetical protein